MTHIQLEQDLADIADRREHVTLRRRNSTAEVEVDFALRTAGDSQSNASMAGNSIQTDVTWHLQFSAADVVPRIGDVVVDQQRNRWTILKAERLTLLGRWKCEARELALAHGCHELVDITRPIWGDVGSGQEIVEWANVCAALPACLRLKELVLDASTTPPTKQLLYEIVLSESLELEPDDRVTSENGTRFRLRSLTGAGRIDELPVAIAVREED